MSNDPAPRWARNHQVAKYLNVAPMTTWRWARDPELNFPAPTVINGIEYRNLNQIDEWMKSMVARQRGQRKRSHSASNLGRKMA